MPVELEEDTDAAGRREITRLQRLLDATSDLIWFAGTDGRVTEANPAACDVLGWDLDSAVPLSSSAFTVASRAVIDLNAAPALRHHMTWTGDLTLRGADGEPVPVSVVMVRGSDDVDGTPWIGTVARDQRRSQNRGREVQHRATHDSLTGLSNRDGFDAAACVALAEGPAALLLIDVDHLSIVNDAFGHDAGDAVLVRVADRLRDCLRDQDLAARVGGDEFAVLLPRVALADAAQIAHRIGARLRDLPGADGRAARVTVSTGLAASNSGEGSVRSLFQRAELALLLAKDRRGGGVEIYDAAVHTRLVERSQLRHELGEALARDEFHLVYQPIVGLGDGRLSSVECLLRWRRDQSLPVVGPDLFVPMLEETGWIVDVGAWVLDHAVAQMARWQSSHPSMAGVRINVNVSAVQLNAAFADSVSAALKRHGLRPECLTVELTETALSRDTDDAAAVVSAIHDLGVNISLDDFGTGYSSLASLQRLPIGQLKIDKTFVDVLQTEGDSLTAGVIEMAGALGLRTVAEGVESAEQAAILEALGCDAGQGYLWSRPLPADEIPVFHASRAD